MLKKYFEREDAPKVATITSLCPVEIVKESEDPAPADDVTMSTSCKLQNSDILANLGQAVSPFGAPATTGNIPNF